MVLIVTTEVVVVETTCKKKTKILPKVFLSRCRDFLFSTPSRFTESVSFCLAGRRGKRQHQKMYEKPEAQELFMEVEKGQVQKQRKSDT